jgi:hypothetical protein
LAKFFVFHAVAPELVGVLAFAAISARGPGKTYEFELSNLFRGEMTWKVSIVKENRIGATNGLRTVSSQDVVMATVEQEMLDTPDRISEEDGVEVWW